MEHLVKYGRVSFGSQVCTTGNKRNRETHVPIDFVEHTILTERTCSWIKRAAEGKAANPDRYGKSHVLLIAFEDWIKPSDEDVAAVTTFVRKNVLALPLNFRTLYLVGMWGKTYLRFPLLESEG